MSRAHDRHAHNEGREEPEPQRRHRGAGLVRPRASPHEHLEEAVGETVFAYQLHQPLVDLPQPPRYYLAWCGRDPGEGLLQRLRALTPWIQPLSHCRVTARDGVMDRATGARGIIVQVARLTWLHAAAVEVVGGYYITHRHAAGLRYGVESHGSRWAVTTTHLLWRA
jgi:hypothetical protein